VGARADIFLGARLNNHMIRARADHTKRVVGHRPVVAAIVIEGTVAHPLPHMRPCGVGTAEESACRRVGACGLLGAAPIRDGDGDNSWSRTACVYTVID